MPPASSETAPRVSVVIPLHNQAAYIARTIESVLTQMLRDIELVLVNDGSDDGSGAIIDAWAARDARVRVAHQERQGISAAINRGVELARSGYIARLDGDDMALPDRLEKQAAFLDAHKEVGMVGGSMILIDPEDRKIGLQRYPTDPSVIRTALARETVIGGPTSMIRHHLIAAIGGWRTSFNYAEDYDFCLRMAERADLANLPDFVTYYRLHPKQTTALYRDRQSALAEVARVAARLRRTTGTDSIVPDAQIDASTVNSLALEEAETERLRALFNPAVAS